MVTVQFPTFSVDVSEVVPPADQPEIPATVQLVFQSGIAVGEGQVLPSARYVTQLDSAAAQVVGKALIEAAGNLPARSDLAVVRGPGAQQAADQAAQNAERIIFPHGKPQAA